MAKKINNFVATLDEVLRFLDSYQQDLFYFDIDAKTPPNGARTFDITTFPAELAEQVLKEIHAGIEQPRLTPQAKAAIQTYAPDDLGFACGMNIHPHNRQAYPEIPPDLAKVGWVRFPILGSEARYPSLEKALEFHDKAIDAYNKLGVKILLVLTHELYGEGKFNWEGMDASSWARLTDDYAPILETVVKRYKGKIHAYEVWNEGDVDVGNPSAVAIPPKVYAKFLTRMSQIINTHDPDAKVIFQGLVKGTHESVTYLKNVKDALGGNLPVDAIGLHPYGKGAPHDKTVFSRFGSIKNDIIEFLKVAPDKPLWLTEVGALGTDDPNYWDDAAAYLDTLYTYLREHHAQEVPVVIWYAWSDAMDIAQKTNGVVKMDGTPKPHVYDAFLKIACGDA